jgi:iron complex outermembrane receptor protein
MSVNAINGKRSGMALPVWMSRMSFRYEINLLLCHSVCGLAGLAGLVLSASAGRAQTIDELRGLSIEQLAAIQVTSVSKSAEPLSDAPAAIFVISHDDVIRSGATTIPEMLRLAPNLEVVQLNSTSYAISARGFNVGDNASLSNKLLVLIDGRSVYSPMFGGVYWDMQSVPPEDIERIEVISGPGAALWGANAVNGVVNIITRSSSDTQGGLLTLGAGNLEQDVGLQYGGRINADLTYRVHGEFSNFAAYQQANGSSAGDQWSRPSGGFRLDWKHPDDSVSLQGDLLTSEQQPGGFVRGSDAVATWHHDFSDTSSLQLLAYYDNEYRSVNNGSSFTVNTYDIEVQHNFTAGGWNNIVWGAGERAVTYSFENTDLALVPPKQTLNLANIFVQDTVPLAARLKLTLGLKLEDEPYAGWQFMPSVRIAWKVTDTALLWAAVSRALRSPTPVDTNIQEYVGGVDFLKGSTAFRPETLTAYEIGARAQVTPEASVSVSTYYDVYDNLRTIDPSNTPTALPLQFGNQMTGRVYGVEVWGTYQVASWWRLSAGFNLQHEDLTFQAGALTSVGLAFVADDPNQRATLHSAMDLGEDVTWDAYLREVGSLQHPQVPGYAELDTRLGWNVTKALQLSLSGFNLLHARHEEFIEGGVTTEVPRSVLAQARIRF